MTLTEMYYDVNNSSYRDYCDKGTVHNYINLYYENEFGSKKDEPLNILEIGVWAGGSMRLWDDFFTNSKITGLDSHNYVNDMFKCYLRTSYKHIDAYLDSTVDLFNDNHFDYVIDDGPHTLESMVTCIQKYLPKVKSGGKVIIEDVQEIEWIKTLENCIDKNIAESWRTLDMRESKGRYDDIIFEIIKK